MSYLIDNWSFDPFLILVLPGRRHETGLARLARRSRPERTRQRRIRSIWFYSGLAVLLIAVESPIDYWADGYFFVHMFQHLLLMFAAPTLVVGGRPLAAAARRAARADGPGSNGCGAAGCLVTPAPGDRQSPAAAVGLGFPVFRGHAGLAHSLAVRSRAAESGRDIWLVHGSFFLAGVLFWLQFIPSPPFQRRMPLVSQAVALIGTNLVMWMLAMAMSIFSQHAWYPVYSHVPG